MNFLKKGYIYIIIWLIINLLQAYFTELGNDEAYYWMFSKHLDWGYYDHPPMTPFLIHLGYSLIPNELGVRLFIVLIATVTQFFLWKITNPKDPHLYFSIVFSSFLVHIGGFFAAPDISLMFFTTLFIYLYKRYEANDDLVAKGAALKYAFLLGIVLAGMAYSKYHGAIIVTGILISHLALLKRTSFWFIVITATILFLPHFYWLYQHNFAPFIFHWRDRSPQIYRWTYFLEYIGGQLLILGPLTSLIVVRAIYAYRPTDRFSRSMWGAMLFVFSFFLLNSLRAPVEANWTATGFIPLFYIAYHAFEKQVHLQKYLYRLAVPSILLLLIFRIFLAYNFLPFLKLERNEFHGWKDWAKKIEQVAGDRPVLSINSYQNASKYEFYTGKPAFSFNIPNYHGNQYDFWYDLEENIQDKNVLTLTPYLYGGKEPDSLIISDKWVEKYVETANFHSYSRIKIDILDKNNGEWKSDDSLNLRLRLSNPTDKKITVDPKIANVYFQYNFFHYTQQLAEEHLDNDILPLKFELNPHESMETSISIKTPKFVGKLRFRPSLFVVGFPAGNNSPYYSVKLY